MGVIVKGSSECGPAMNEKKEDNTFKLSKLKIIMGILVVAVAIITVIVAGFKIKNSKINISESVAEISTESSDTEAELSIEFSYGDDYWEKNDLTNAVYKTQVEFEDAVCNYIKQITILLGREDWYKQYGNSTIKIYVVFDKNSSLSGKMTPPNTLNKRFTLTFDNAMFDHNCLPLVHELTHLVTYSKSIVAPSFAISLSEGVAEYDGNYFLNGSTSTVNYGLDVNNVLIAYAKHYENDSEKNSKMNEVFNSIGTASKVYPDEEYRYYLLLCGSSFVDYLVRTYGIDDTMVMINGNDESVYYLFHDDGLSGLVSDWRQFLENYSCQMTWDEIRNSRLEWLVAHSY